MQVQVENEPSKESGSSTNRNRDIPDLATGAGCGIWCGRVAWGCFGQSSSDDNTCMEHKTPESEKDSQSCAKPDNREELGDINENTMTDGQDIKINNV